MTDVPNVAEKVYLIFILKVNSEEASDLLCAVPVTKMIKNICAEMIMSKLMMTMIMLVKMLLI